MVALKQRAASHAKVTDALVEHANYTDQTQRYVERALGNQYVVINIEINYAANQDVLNDCVEAALDYLGPCQVLDQARRGRPRFSAQYFTPFFFRARNDCS
jgi:hypothetical protein